MSATHREDATTRTEAESAVHRGVDRIPRWRANLEQELDAARGARSIIAAVLVVALLGLAVAGDPATSSVASTGEGVAAAAADTPRR